MTPPASRVAAARNGDMLVFAAAGFLFASWMSRVPDVKQMLGLSPGELGLLLLALALGALAGLPAAGRIAQRVGAAKTVRIGVALVIGGILLAALAVEARAPFHLVMPGLFVVGVGNGIWDVAQNLAGTIIEQALGRAIMPWFHAAFSGGTVIAAGLGAGLVWLKVPVSIHLFGVAIIIGLAGWLGTRTLLEAPTTSASDPAATDSAGSAWREPRTLLIGVMVLAAAFTEGTANDWMAVAFVEGHQVSNAMGVVALGVFLCFMTAGRILGTGLLDRYGRVAVLRTLFLASVAGSLLVVFGSPWLAFAGSAIWGLGASLGFPVGMSAAADDPARAAARLSVVSTIGYGAFLAGPVVLGFLGDQVGVLNALLAVTATAVPALFVVGFARPPDH